MILRKLLPLPGLSLVLLLIWLLLQNTAAPGHLLLGTILAIVIPRWCADFWPRQLAVRRVGVMVAFLATVLWDIVVANVSVARILLSPAPRLRPGFFELPVSVTNQVALVLLANTISLTPGTVAARLSADRSRLLVHCLDMDDEATLITQIKNRYERPLKEIFE
jgi:multicomponent K+:H+ antiporter subunit E